MEEQLTRKQRFYIANAERLRQESREYYHNNKEKELERRNKYNEEHKEYMYERIICNICGGQICRHGLARHQKTKKCKSFVKLTENDNYIIVGGRTYLKGESPLEGVWHKDHTPFEVKHYAIIEKISPEVCWSLRDKNINFKRDPDILYVMMT